MVDSVKEDCIRVRKTNDKVAVIAEIVRTLSKYNWAGDVISTAVMSFSTFGFYGQRKNRTNFSQQILSAKWNKNG